MNLRRIWNKLSMCEKATHLTVGGTTAFLSMLYGMSELMFSINPQAATEKTCENLEELVTEASCAVSANITCSLPNIPLDEYFQMVKENCQNPDLIIENADLRQLWLSVAETAVLFYACVVALNLFYRGTKYAYDTCTQTKAITEAKTDENSAAVTVNEQPSKSEKSSKRDWTRLCCWRKGEREPLLPPPNTSSSSKMTLSRSSE